MPGEISINGPDELSRVPTAFGLVALAICYDFDFPGLARQGAGATMALVPGSDWPAIDPLHPQMAALRAVENGYAVIRPSRESVSVAYDQYGRLLGRVEWRGVAQPTLAADVPLQSVPTLYARIGDLFAIVAALALTILALIALLGGRTSGRRFADRSPPA